MIMSGKLVSFLVVALLLQAGLLQSKSLRNPRQSFGGIDGDPDQQMTEQSAGADSACSPSQDQLESYSQLHGATAINGLNGNTLYYTLRAMEAHNQNRTVSTTITAEDNAIIANITDHSRFTPAGMETANKVVCAQILHELDAEASVISNTAVCPWDYFCEYKADRYPNYLFKARCKTNMCSGNCSPEDRRHNVCQIHGIQVPILQMSSCREWDPEEELLPIACTCSNNV